MKLRKQYPLAYNPILEYWEKVESGEVVGQKVRRIYKKLAADVYDKETVYEYNPKRANHTLEFIENYCKHSKGKWAGKPIDLELWQKAFIAATFGFIHKIDGTRKYREVFFSCSAEKWEVYPFLRHLPLPPSRGRRGWSRNLCSCNQGKTGKDCVA